MDRDFLPGRMHWLVVAIAAAMLIVAACDGRETNGAPTSPNPVPSSAPSTSPVVRLDLSGPATLAPRNQGTSLGAYTATAIRANGTTSDVTALARWSATNQGFGVLHSTNIPGEMQSEGPGQAVIHAVYENVTGEFTVTVIAPGTFVLSGRVVAETTLEPLRAVVSVAAGVGTGIRFVSGDDGRYAIYGVAGLVEIHAEAEGFEPQAFSFTARAAETREIRMRTPRAVPDLRGSWRMTIAASSSCRDRLAEIARDRSFDAEIQQGSAQLRVRLSAPSIWSTQGLGAFYFDGYLDGTSAFLVIPGDTSYSTFNSSSFGERLSATESWQAEGVLQGRAESSTLVLSMSGDIIYQKSTDRFFEPSGICRASDHVVTFSRR